MKMLYELKKVLPESEYEKVAYGVGAVINEVFSSIAGNSLKRSFSS